MERRSFDAFKAGGILSYNTAVQIRSSTRSHPRWWWCSGTGYCDTDAIEAAFCVKSDSGNLRKELREFSKHLPYLAMLCDNIAMTVIHPMSLKSANAPVLSWNGDG